MSPKKSQHFLENLRKKASWVRRETLRIHRVSPETRLASSLSCIEIFCVLYYGKILNFNPSKPKWDNRDRFIISKGHGSVSLYPILADLGYFDVEELSRVGKEGSILGGIPDATIPGFETTNGSLGHGLGVACGAALALKRKRNRSQIFILLGDGELFEGSVWEAIMFAGEHKLSNLTLIIDNNKICMLNYCKNILDLEPIDEKFISFKWNVKRVDGHDFIQLYDALNSLNEIDDSRPKILIADTLKGKGVPCLENNPLCHVKSLSPDEIDELIKVL